PLTALCVKECVHARPQPSAHVYFTTRAGRRGADRGASRDLRTNATRGRTAGVSCKSPGLHRSREAPRAAPRRPGRGRVGGGGRETEDGQEESGEPAAGHDEERE